MTTIEKRSKNENGRVASPEKYTLVIGAMHNLQIRNITCISVLSAQEGVGRNVSSVLNQVGIIIL